MNAFKMLDAEWKEQQQSKKKKKKKKDLLTITKVIPKISKRAHAYFQVLNLDRNLQENTNILLYCKTI